MSVAKNPAAKPASNNLSDISIPQKKAQQHPIKHSCKGAIAHGERGPAPICLLDTVIGLAYFRGRIGRLSSTRSFFNGARDKEGDQAVWYRWGRAFAWPHLGALADDLLSGLRRD
jgi:hypothetical protein